MFDVNWILYQFRFYAKTTFLYKIRIYEKSTCVHALIAMEIFHYTRGWNSPTRMVSDMDAMFSCIFNLCDVRMRIAITCIVPRCYLRGPPYKISRFLGVVLSGGEVGKGRFKPNKITSNPIRVFSSFVSLAWFIASPESTNYADKLSKNGGRSFYTFFRQIIFFKCSSTWSCVSLSRPTTSYWWKLLIFV